MVITFLLAVILWPAGRAYAGQCPPSWVSDEGNVFQEPSAAKADVASGVVAGEWQWVDGRWEAPGFSEVTGNQVTTLQVNPVCPDAGSYDHTLGARVGSTVESATFARPARK